MTTRHIGIVACSAEGAALCYRHIAAHAAQLMGPYTHPQVTLSSIAMAYWMEAFNSGDYDAVAEFMLRELQIVAKAGADLAICPDNSAHLAWDKVIPRSPIPWLHIADVVAQSAERRGYKKAGLLGTLFTMRGPVYREIFAKRGIELAVPQRDDQSGVDRVIWEELVNGQILESSRLYYNEVIERLKEEHCDCVVLGCTEIPLLVNPLDCPLPVLDSTRLLAEAAVKYALDPADARPSSPEQRCSHGAKQGG